MRSPSDMDILVIDITNRCFLRCSNCTRAIAHQTHTKEMSLETFDKAVASLERWWKPGKVIGIIGGEPTLHSQFEEICRILRRSELLPHFPNDQAERGREPISDFNKYATERLFDRRNGRGLWTSFGPKFMEHFEAISDTFSHWNPNDHSQGGKHQTYMVDAREMCAALGIPWEEFPKYRDNCWLQNQWSGSITPSGKAYFCEVAGQLDELYNEGRLGWDIEKEPEWWKRKPAEFGDQLKLCEMCSMCLPGTSQVDKTDTDIISPNHWKRLMELGSPAAKGARFEIFSTEKHCESRTIETKDNYVGESGVRVADHNKYVRPRKLTCVVTCVSRFEHLWQTAVHNSKQCDDMVVVHDLLDHESSQWLHSRQVHFLPSKRYCEDDAAFNKGKMLNDALKAVKEPDWILFTDADIYLNEKLLEYFHSHTFNPGCLYYTDRIDGPGGNVDSEPNGYFQLWHPSAQALRGKKWPNIMCENFCSAAGIDTWFLRQYPRDKRIRIPELAVTHIKHEPDQWNGNRRGKLWRQVGIITPEGYSGRLFDCSVPMRYTDTLRGEMVETDSRTIANLSANMKTGDIHFNGKKIGHCYVVVSALTEE